ncbi:CHAD domain-containing protein [Paraburkholderia bryophila]|uniref:CHAD domain-containing protein n=1 Tax=Paraburkholderia bryophila TaxID=420952 RepID=UPI0023498206|nr:CHAD domain-containing protein [Paraburkholderia bryophila]WCM18328.1 CHAD domain-containing protein [Paraburkholderia bryophila]WCM18722.1 CHAD domain-containing protein [Paraburkholderia bryophila]
MSDDAGSPSKVRDTAEASFLSYASPLADEVLAHLVELSSNPDAEVLHRLRVALRRLRALSWVYRPLLDRQLEEKQRTLFKQLADAAGATRDWDIAIELIGQTARNVHTPTAHLMSARRRALETSRYVFSHESVSAALRNAVADANRAINASGDSTLLTKFASERLVSAQRALRKRMRAAARAKRSADAVHEARKAGKKVRYLLEFFGPLLTKRQLKPLKELVEIHRRFGALNDVVASEALLGAHPEVFPSAEVHQDTMCALKKERKRRMRSAAKLL